MAWGISYFMGIDVFQYGWFAVFYFMGFFLIFSYLGFRATQERPWNAAAKLVGLTMVAGLFLAFTSLPSLLVGTIVVIIFALIRRWMLKPDFHGFVSHFITLWILLALFALIPIAYAYVYSVFALIYFYWISEMDIKTAKKEKDAKGEKPKK
ncbi:MAG: hypothetical protein WCI04_02425 [archaeon]